MYAVYEFAFDTMYAVYMCHACSEHAHADMIRQDCTNLLCTCAQILRTCRIWNREPAQNMSTCDSSQTCHVATFRTKSRLGGFGWHHVWYMVGSSETNFRRFRGFRGFGRQKCRKCTFWRKCTFSMFPANSALSRLFAQSRESAGLARNMCQVLKKSSKPAKPGFQVLYIDHFQLPPRWKMTGEDGDPFRGRRWHCPSKRSIFEKNLLFTKSLKIAEKGTFFSFTPKNRWKSLFFYPPKSDFCRLPRRVVPTAHSTFLSIFFKRESALQTRKLRAKSPTCGLSGLSKIVKNFKNFTFSRFCENPKILRFFWFFVIRHVPYTNRQNRNFSQLFATFVDFADFVDFCKFLDFSRFRKTRNFSSFGTRSWHVQNLVSELVCRYDIRDTQNPSLRCPKVANFCIHAASESCTFRVVKTIALGELCLLFFWVFETSKNWKNISLWPQPP